MPHDRVIIAAAITLAVIGLIDALNTLGKRRFAIAALELEAARETRRTAEILTRGADAGDPDADQSRMIDDAPALQ